jgi:hypothetical protein
MRLVRQGLYRLVGAVLRFLAILLAYKPELLPPPEAKQFLAYLLPELLVP